MIVALFPHLQKKPALNLAVGIREFFTARHVTVAVPDESAEAISATPLSHVDPDSIDFLISLGGDGSILHLVHTYSNLTAPIVGINLGHLGFMADIPLSDLYPSLQDLLDGHYVVEQRIMMEGQSPSSEEPLLSVNDIVVHRSRNPSLVDLAIHVDGAYLNTFSADGIIVATPSGSTAYSLAAGGPILSPELEAFVITPISPHTISNRPIVLLPSQDIQIQYLSEHEPVEVVHDGYSSRALHTGEVFRIARSQRRFRLIALKRRDYFHTLRKKLGWTGKLRA